MGSDSVPSCHCGLGDEGLSTYSSTTPRPSRGKPMNYDPVSPTVKDKP